MENNQRRFIDYASFYAANNRRHIWLGGSFLRGNPSAFSDVDISALMNKEALEDFISGYGKPIYLSYTSNPEGIIIVIYEDGTAVDLEVIGSIDVTDNEFFHREDIKEREYSRNSSICKEICNRSDLPYQTARLFHRSLIKYLSGKKDSGVSIADEIAVFLNADLTVTKSGYKDQITGLMEQFNDRYPLDEEYFDLCCRLADLTEE